MSECTNFAWRQLLRDLGRMRLIMAILMEHVRVCYFGCLKGGSESVQVLLNALEAVLVLTLTFLT